MTDSPSAPLIPIVLAAVALTALVFLIIVLVKRRSSRRRVEKVLKAICAEQMQNVIIPDGLGGHVHLDHLLLTRDGLLVLDVRDVSGNVFGASQMDQWTVLGKERRWTFPNPTAPLSERVIAVRALAQSVPVTGHVVFTPTASFPRGVPDGVVMLEELADRYGADRRKGEPAIEAFYTYWSHIREVAQPA